MESRISSTVIGITATRFTVTGSKISRTLEFGFLLASRRASVCRDCETSADSHSENAYRLPPALPYGCAGFPCSIGRCDSNSISKVGALAHDRAPAPKTSIVSSKSHPKSSRIEPVRSARNGQGTPSSTEPSDYGRVSYFENSEAAFLVRRSAELFDVHNASDTNPAKIPGVPCQGQGRAHSRAGHQIASRLY
jgi:hypothetical protein